MTTTSFPCSAADGYIRGNNAVYATARSTSNSVTFTNTGTGVSNVIIGDYYVDRALLLFDTSAIGAGSTVTQVNLKMTQVDNNGSPSDDVQIVKYDWSALAADPTNATKRETAYDGILAGDLDDSIFINEAASPGYGSQATSGNLSTAWVNKTGITYYALRMKKDADGTAPTAYANIVWGTANNATEAWRPVLVVTYTEAASGSKHFLSLLGVGK